MAADDEASCPACGGSLAREARFCHRCGTPLDVPSAKGADVASGNTELAGTEAGGGVPLPPMRLSPGTMISVYRIESVVGEGGMGVVYRATDTAAKRTVAVKCLHTNLAGDPQIRQRFAREARVLRVWSHPGAVAVYDFVEHQHL